MNEKILEDVGLTKGEITVYLTLLKIGETTTGGIIKNAQISSGKIYEILDKLIAKGLVSFIIKEKTKYFSAASPRRILDYIHEKENALQNQEQIFKIELPALIALEQEKKPQYEAVIFKGIQGMQNAIFSQFEYAKKDDMVLAMGISEKKDKKYNLMWLKWHEERARRKLKAKLIFSERNTEYYKAYNRHPLTERRVLKGITPAAINMLGDVVIILHYGKDPQCVFIRNPEIAKSFSAFFNNLWEMAEE